MLADLRCVAQQLNASVVSPSNSQRTCAAHPIKISEKMKTITTTSGDIVNLDQIALITVDRRQSDKPVLTVHFPAGLTNGREAESLRLSIDGDEAREFLTSLRAHGVEVEATLRAINKSAK